MDSYLVSPWIFLFVTLSIWFVHVHGQTNNFIVTDFGAIADGKTDNSQAFLDAWKKACETEGGRVSVPAGGGSFYMSGADFKGPCTGQTTFRIDGTVIASDDPTLYDRDCWIIFHEIDCFTLSGNGLFDGNGDSSWSRCHAANSLCNPKPPTTIKINHVTNALIQDINLVNSKMFHLHIHESENVIVDNVHITAPEDSPNTDGIHIGDSNNIKVIDSHIATGDDCVSIGEGSVNVNISGVWCGPGHGISIGSLGKYQLEDNVSGITVRNCTLNNTDNGLRIKTWAPSKSANVVSNITFTDINIYNVDNPIIIDQYYCPYHSCSHDGESSVEIKRVKFIGVRGSSASEASVNVECSKSKPCQDIEFRGLDLTFNGQPSTAVCSSADDKFEGSPQVPSQCTLPQSPPIGFGLAS